MTENNQNLPATQSQAVSAAGGQPPVALVDMPLQRMTQNLQILEHQLKMYDMGMKLADQFVDARLVPDSFLNKPDSGQKGTNKGAVAIAIIAGLEVGFSPIQALQCFYVINGIPSMYGMGPSALVEQSGVLEWIKDEWDPSLPGGGGYRTIAKRKGKPEPYTTSFSMEEAERGKLLEKKGPWQWDEKEMCMYRSRGRMWKHYFSDVLKGIRQSEELAREQASLEAPAPALDSRQAALQDHLSKAVEQTAQQGATIAGTPPSSPAPELTREQIKTRKMISGKLQRLVTEKAGEKTIWTGIILEHPTTKAEVLMKIDNGITLQPAIAPQSFVGKDVLITYSEQNKAFLVYVMAAANPDDFKPKPADKKKPAATKAAAPTSTQSAPPASDPMTIEATGKEIAGTPPADNLGAPKTSFEIDANTLSQILDCQSELTGTQKGQAIFAGLKKDFRITSREPLDDLKEEQIGPYLDALKLAVERAQTPS